MMSSELDAFIAALRFNGDESVIYGDRVPFALRRASEGRESLRHALVEFFYKYLYCHPDGNAGNAFSECAADADLLRAFSRQPAAATQLQHGWVVHGVQDNGSVIAQRFAQVQKLLPGQYVAPAGCLPMQPGTEVSAYPLLRTGLLQPGFHHSFGAYPLDLSEIAQQVCIYWNAQYDGAPEIHQRITDCLDSHQIAYIFKIATRRCDYSWRDCAVLYLPRRMYRVATLALAPHIPRLVSLLGADTPFFTRPLARGIAVAECPREGSFGSNRSDIVADAILEVRDGNRVPLEPFRTAFVQKVQQRGLNPDALHLNPGSEDTYDVSGIWAETIDKETADAMV